MVRVDKNHLSKIIKWLLRTSNDLDTTVNFYIKYLIHLSGQQNDEWLWWITVTGEKFILYPLKMTSLQNVWEAQTYLEIIQWLR